MANENLANLLIDLKRQASDLSERIGVLKGPLAIEKKKARLAEIDLAMEAPEFWNDQKAAAILQKERTDLERPVVKFEKAAALAGDCEELLGMMGNDASEAKSLEKDIVNLEVVVTEIEMERMLGEPMDKNNAILSVNVGAGGVDSQDFTEMLLRMYKRYAERRGYSVELLDITDGEEAGLKNATILVKGEFAYGYLKAEIGVHRLVRISPFDSASRRHTSFAAVWVLPEIDDDIEVEIKSDDLRVDTYRAGGAGGQHVNKTDSAVRITHIPTGAVVACQSERSQTKNRATAMKLLKAKLYDLEMKKRLAEKDKAEAEKMEISFGSQIRNYVLAPYRLAKDLRTNYEIGNVDAVLDGDIQPFIEQFLLWRSNK